MDATIESMQLHPDGFYFVRVRSNFTQYEFVCHNRNGAWFAVPEEGMVTDRRAPMRDVMPGLAEVLQRRMKEADRAGIEPVNPFGIVPPTNPFMTQTPEPDINPFMTLG